MADAKTPNEEGNTPNGEGANQTAAAAQSGGGEAKTFTQEQVDKIVQERLKRAKSEPPADYDELKAKAAKYDELEDANKTEMERMQEQAAKAQESAREWQQKAEALEAQRKHDAEVRDAASEYGVDAEVLMRMGGDVTENAKFLQAKETARPKFGDLHDGSGQAAVTKTLDEALEGVTSQKDRIRIRAEYNAQRRANK